MIQPKYRQLMASYKLAVHCVPLELMIRDIEVLYRWATIVWPWMNLIKIKSDTTKMYATCGFLQIGCVLESTRSNNKWDRGTFMFGSHDITLKEWPNVTSVRSKAIVFAWQKRSVPERCILSAHIIPERCILSA